MKTSAVLLLLAALTAVSAFNITQELQNDPTYSEFNDILTKSGLASQINSRNSITVCVLPNQQIDQLRNSLGPLATDKQLSDIVRTHILLTFIDPANIKKTGTGDEQVTSLYQTTGKAPGESGIANLTSTKNGLEIVMTGSNTTITKTVKTIGYNLSIVEVDRALTPLGVLPIAPSPAPPPGVVPVPAPVPVAPAPVVVPAPDASSPVKAKSPADSSNSNSAFTVRVIGLGPVLAASGLGLMALLW